MTKTCCPNCHSTTELSVEIKRSYKLNWNDRCNEYEVGNLVDRYNVPSYEDDNEVTCECGWSGRFSELKPVTERYRVVLILDIAPEQRGKLGDWDWKDMLDLQPYEDVTVDGVNKL